MARTTVTLVQALLQQDYDTNNNPDLNQYIAGATLFVNKVVSMQRWLDWVPAADQTASAEYLERLISAHMYCCVDQPYSSKSTSNASGSFQGKTDKKLQGTKYGQMALDFDVSGVTSALDQRAVVTSMWGGSQPAPYPPSQFPWPGGYG